jgi:hypothetical protein
VIESFGNSHRSGVTAPAASVNLPEMAAGSEANTCTMSGTASSLTLPPAKQIAIDGAFLQRHQLHAARKGRRLARRLQVQARRCAVPVDGSCALASDKPAAMRAMVEEIIR